MSDPASLTRLVLTPEQLAALLVALRQRGYTVVGPTVDAGAVVYAPIEALAQLPVGLSDEQDGGHYRLVARGDRALFGYTHSPQSWKRHLFPPNQRLWRAQQRDRGFSVEPEAAPSDRYAFLGVRACELRAMEVQDRVFDNGQFTEPGYQRRRAEAFVIAVNCTRSGGTCFCVSMGTGPAVDTGFDLALTELIDAERHEFLVEVGSKRGAEVLAEVPARAAQDADREAATAAVAGAAAQMGRAMVPDVAALLQRNPTHPQWDAVAKRCLSCGNCTMACPTCFCTTVEDVTDLQGTSAERWRRWDSCFTADFSYIHGGSIRRETASHYRQWMTHKLSSWWEQFGSSGCVGCGRCITWCPVGIDLTEEARAIQANERRS
jgi:ferredoxin